jgi:lipoprotein-anchoring transpeptidase ErfK/SrfK
MRMFGLRRALTRGWQVSAIAVAMVAAGGYSASAELLDGVQVASLETETAVVDESSGELVLARVDLSDQTMHVYVGEKLMHVFPVSSGRGSYRTPTGRWQAEWLSPRHRSRKYNNAPMPWSVFFYRGYAVHGTTDLKRLGTPASHGCIRLHPDNAKTFFQLVKANGMDNSLIAVVR